MATAPDVLPSGKYICLTVARSTARDADQDVGGASGGDERESSSSSYWVLFAVVGLAALCWKVGCLKVSLVQDRWLVLEAGSCC